MCAAPAPAQSSGDTSGETALQNGDFERAKTFFAQTAAGNPRDAGAQVGLATVALYQNRLGEAGAALSRALALSPGDRQAQALQRIVKERRGSPLDYAIKRYPGFSAGLLAGAPVPLVRARINGIKDAVFAVDTTAPGAFLSFEAGRALGLQTFAPARLSSLRIGDGEIDGIPVRFVEMNPRAVAGGEPVAGVLGIAFLSHFFVTLDSPAGRFGLEPPRAAGHGERGASPMWQCDDRHLFTSARLNTAPPALFSIDTGVTGGLMVTAQSIAAGHIAFDRIKMAQVGNTASVRMLPFTASLTLAGHTFEKLDGSLLAQGTPTGEFPFPIGGTLGNGTLRTMRLTLDFANMEVTAAPGR
jgi:hypothetical protein